MSEPRVLSTVLDTTWRGAGGSRRLTRGHARPSSESSEDHLSATDPELKLPKLSSLATVLASNALFQLSYFIIVPTSSMYTEHLGGTATFSGLIIGIPIVFSGMALIPMTRLDRGQYGHPFTIAMAAAILGNVLYSLAYKTDFLYLILIGRVVMSFSFTSFLYSKRYCSDPRLVGVRRRTTLAGWLVVGQGFGFSAGPFVGGLLYKVGFPNSIFNGYTSSGWVMAGVWMVFGALAYLLFRDVPTLPPQTFIIQLTAAETSSPSIRDMPSVPAPASVLPLSPTLIDGDAEESTLNKRQWGVVACMCWYAMTCFFILGGWEVNIPIYSAATFGWSPFKSGNFIALGGIATFPFLLINVWYARRLQDRHILAFGASLGMVGLLVMIALVATSTAFFGPFLFCWFLVALGFNLASTVTLSLLTK